MNNSLTFDDLTAKAEHHGIKGMHWYVRRYQNKDGSLKPAGVKRYGKDRNVDGSLTVYRDPRLLKLGTRARKFNGQKFRNKRTAYRHSWSLLHPFTFKDDEPARYDEHGKIPAVVSKNIRAMGFDPDKVIIKGDVRGREFRILDGDNAYNHGGVQADELNRAISKNREQLVSSFNDLLKEK